ncbi:hypothetical protein GGI19_001314 [Coemansia pectinata]|uniref:Uncharacterized protein n=1 Tax=Coemansia pectinata TaxID=1052879 RepID=A0A9W8GXY3_9FUNG|nr:hypothetical protein GGI19_001314 [Coemansia pectinata]
MVRQTGGRRTDNNSGGTADRGGGGARGGGAVGRGGGNGGMVRKAVFRPTVRAPPIGAPPTFGGNSSGEPVPADTTRAGNSSRGGGLLLVNRKPAAVAVASTTTASTATNTDTPGAAATLGSHSNAASQAKGGPKPAAENPWAVRSQRQEAAAAAATKPSRPTAAMLNGRRHPQAMPELVGDDDYEGKEKWDEMLDKGFDFSQDIEFGDGTAVRINSRTRSKLPPSLPPTPTANVAVVDSPPPAAEVGPVQPTQPSNDAIPDPSSPASTAPKLPATHASPAAVELPPTTPRAVETSWGKPAKPAAGAAAPSAEAPASARWWKASLSNNSTARPPQQQQPQMQAVGSRSNVNPISTPAPGRSSAPTRVEVSDGNSSSNSGQTQRGGRGERGGRPGRGSRRSLAPIPTVVPPVLLRRPTQPPPAALAEPCLVPEQAAANVAAIVEPPAPSSTIEEPNPKDNASDNITPTPPVKGAAAAPKQQPQPTPPVAPAETGSNLPRNPKKTAEPGSRKPNGTGSGTAEPSRLADNWRAGTAPRPPAPQPTAPTQVTTSGATADGPVEAARVPVNAARRRSTGAAKVAGNAPSVPGPGSRPAVQQDKPDRIPANKPSAAATATSWRADPNRAKPAADASTHAPAPEEAHDAIGVGRQRAQTQGAAGGSHNLPSSRATGPGAYSGPAGSNQSQMNGLLHVMPQTTLSTSPPLLPQTMLADLLDEHEGSSHGKQPVASPAKPPAPIRGNSGGAVPASRAAEQNEASAMPRQQQQQSRLGYGGAAVIPISSSSLFNVEGSPLMGSNSSYNAPIRPAFGHADPGLFTWQGSHMGFHDARARQEYLLQANTAPESNAPYAASREQPVRWSNTGVGEFSQQPHGVGSGVTFSSFSAGAGMLWMDPMAYDSEGRSFPAPIESRSSSHGDNGSGSASGSGAGSSSGGARGYRAPGRTPRPIGTRSVPGNNTQRNTRSRQGGAHQSYVHGAPSPVPQNSQHPLFVPASHMHQSWLPHYSLMQVPAYGATSDARFGRASPRHSPQMTAAPQASNGPAGSAGAAPYMVPLTHAMEHQSMHQMPALPGNRNGVTSGPFANMPSAQYMPDSFRPSPPPPPMYQYGYMGGAPPPPSTKQNKAGQTPATSMPPAPHYHHGYPPQLAMPPPNHTGAPPHMAFMPMYIPGDHGAIGGNGNPAYYYGQQQQPFGNAPPLLGQYQQQQTQQMPGYPNAMHMAEAQQQGYLGYQAEQQQMAATKQAEKLLGISRSSSTSTRDRGGHGSSKGTSALSEPQQANANMVATAAPTTTLPASNTATGNGEAATMPRTGSTSKSHANVASSSVPQTKAGGDRTRQRGRGNERKAAPVNKTNESGEASSQPRQQQQRPDTKRAQHVVKTDDKTRKQQPRTGNSSGPCEDGKASTSEPGPSEKPARRNRGGNRSGRGGGGGAKKNTTTAKS